MPPEIIQKTCCVFTANLKHIKDTFKIIVFEKGAVEVYLV